MINTTRTSVSYPNRADGQLRLGPGDRFQNTKLTNTVSAADYYRYYAQNPISVVPASTVNQQSTLREITRNGTADGTPLPLVYGRAQIGGRLFAVDYDSTTGTWTAGYLLCYGEIESIAQIWINDAAPVAGVTTASYTGTLVQAADSLLSAAIAGYSDTLIVTDPAGNFGIAYVVIQYTNAHYDSWPDVVVEVEGKKVYDPANSPITGSKVYSENPALHLADFITNSQYGLGRTIDWASVATVAAYCDGLTTGSPTETRRTSYTVIQDVRTSESWAEVLRNYASCWITYRGDTVYLIADKAGSSVMTIGEEDIVEGTLRITKTDSSNLPTVIRAWYTDTTGDRWRERLCDPAKASGVDAGTTQWRESRIRLTGVNRHSQAYRECVERLNKLQLSDLRVTWTQFAEAMELEEGDIVTLTHSYGLTSKLLRITAPPSQTSPDHWQIVAEEYSGGSYNETVQDQTPGNDGTLPASITPTAPTGLAATETVYRTGNNTYASRIDISWTPPTNSVVSSYNVIVKDSASPQAVVWSVNTSDTSTATAPLKEGVTYDVEVRAVNEVYTSSAAVDSVTVDGDLSYAVIDVSTTVRTTNFTASANDRYPINTSGGSVTMTLPANPSAGNAVYFFDTGGDFDVNNFIITSGSSPKDKIIELDEDLTVDVRYFSGGLQYVNSTIGWTLV